MQETKEPMKVAKAYKVPPGYETVIMKLDDLDPIDKVREPPLYALIKKTFASNGLFHPLTVLRITRTDWENETEWDQDMLPPPVGGEELRNRVQCGCNRYWLLRELGYDAVECVVVDEKEEAWDLCHTMRIDKSWQRVMNWLPTFREDGTTETRFRR